MELIMDLIYLIPRQPEYKSYIFYCPTCDKPVRLGYEERKPNKCKCGQLLIWNDNRQR